MKFFALPLVCSFLLFGAASLLISAQAPSPAPLGASEDRIRENGVDVWLGFEPTRVVRVEAGYSRSLTFALNRFSFNVGLNVGRLFKERVRQE